MRLKEHWKIVRPRPKSIKERARERKRKSRALKKKRSQLLLLGDSNTKIVQKLIEKKTGVPLKSVARPGANIAAIATGHL